MKLAIYGNPTRSQQLPSSRIRFYNKLWGKIKAKPSQTKIIKYSEINSIGSIFKSLKSQTTHPPYQNLKKITFSLD